MLRKVEVKTEYKGGDGRWRPDVGFAAINPDHIAWAQAQESWQDKSVTHVHFKDGTGLDVLLSIDQVIGLQG